MAYYMGEFHWIQILVCLIIVTIGSMLVPRVFRKTGMYLKTGLDAYIGKTTVIKIIDGQAKVTLDGVDRLVAGEEDLQAGEKVIIIGREGTILEVQRK